ncbi:hypothetical protein CN090_04155 [Sinorhizobium meliloti]|uniref:hypothetical protein n=1 Tax=Rhizobium meliloti TaxID=382 RepID=UPI000FD7B6D1|nr:hypothetical protein [Sinorhizobium meliloti]RVO55120.1 hypothetical protein CN090_04155 [Sinorhizobium meliloti]
MTYQFHVGMMVQCIDDKVPLEGGIVVKDAAITEGTVYKIRWVGMATHYVFGSYLGVKLEGVDSKFGEAWGVKDAPFAARRFRPLVNDRLASLRALQNPNQPIAPAPEEPRRVKRKEEDKV